MAQKDTSEKILESYNDVFSDIVNVLLFNGKQVLSADELEDQAPRSYYKADGKIREIERDVAKRWKNGNIRVACIGFENQTASDPNMPLRVMGYDGAEYWAQLLGDSENLYPVVTLVLYFGHDKPWNGPLSLKERLNIPKEFEPYVNDYKINLFQIAYLTHEQVELFQSDFKVVADYFVQKRENGEEGDDQRNGQQFQKSRIHLIFPPSQETPLSNTAAAPPRSTSGRLPRHPRRNVCRKSEATPRRLPPHDRQTAAG